MKMQILKIFWRPSDAFDLAYYYCGVTWILWTLGVWTTNAVVESWFSIPTQPQTLVWGRLSNIGNGSSLFLIRWEHQISLEPLPKPSKLCIWWDWRKTTISERIPIFFCILGNHLSLFWFFQKSYVDFRFLRVFERCWILRMTIMITSHEFGTFKII